MLEQYFQDGLLSDTSEVSKRTYYRIQQTVNSGIEYLVKERVTSNHGDRGNFIIMNNLSVFIESNTMNK